jgi:hypothetical protein
MKTETIEKNRPSINMVKLEEAQQCFIAVAKQSLADYRATGEHITLDEMETWTDELKNNPKSPLPLFDFVPIMPPLNIHETSISWYFSHTLKNIGLYS